MNMYTPLKSTSSTRESKFKSSAPKVKISPKGLSPPAIQQKPRRGAALLGSREKKKIKTVCGLRIQGNWCSTDKRVPGIITQAKGNGCCSKKKKKKRENKESLQVGQFMPPIASDTGTLSESTFRTRQKQQAPSERVRPAAV